MIFWTVADSSSETVEKEYHSLMNVPFVTGNSELDAKLVGRKEAGFENLKVTGQWAVCGQVFTMPCPIEGVEALTAFMKKFEKENL